MTTPLCLKSITDQQRDALHECLDDLQRHVSSFNSKAAKLRLSQNVVQQIFNSNDVVMNSLRIVEEIREQDQYVEFYKAAVSLKCWRMVAILHPHVQEEHQESLPWALR
mgnify:FL=1